MKFIDLGPQYEALKQPIQQAINKVLEHGQFVLGPEVLELERQLAQYVGVADCITVASGTTALQVALMALDIGPGDEVITSPFSFFASTEMLYLLGATPVYVDIEPDTYNLDVRQLEQAITEKTKAIMPVNLYGQCADMDAINSIAKRQRIPVIEDAAQSFGARYRGRRSCSLATIACTSFFPTKPLGAYGDAGACFTDDIELGQKMRQIMNHGQQTRYQHVQLGINGRCDTLQAAILLCKLPSLEQELAMRRQVAKWYEHALADQFQPPMIAEYNDSVYAQYTIQVARREALQQALQHYQVPSMVHYPTGLHQQPVSLQRECVAQHFPVTERVAAHVLSLPFYSYMSQQAVQQVATALQSATQEICVSE